MRSLKIHWTGPQADTAFKMLKQVTTLKRLIIVVSKSTTNYLSEREAERQAFFTQRKTVPTRLTDALGFNELLELRNLEAVEVEHINRTQALMRTNEDRHNLQGFLMFKMHF